MADQNELQVEVAYALPEKQSLLVVTVAAGTTAREVVLRSGLEKEFPELDLQRCPLGVFGKVVPDAHVLAAGDRVEIYRPLVKDPREARRSLAARGATMGSGKAAGSDA